jgi:hypothetical protein
MAEPKFDPKAEYQETEPQFDESAGFEEYEETGPGMAERLAEIGKEVIQLPEKYLAAPARAAALPVVAEGISGIPKGIEAAVEQFGAPPEEAPTGEEIAKVAGVSSEKYRLPEFEPGMAVPIDTGSMQALVGVSPEQMVPTEAPKSQIAGLAVEAALDPTALALGGAARGIEGAYKFGALPAAGAATRAAGKVAWGAGKELAKGAAEAVGEAAGTMAEGISAGAKAKKTAGQFMEAATQAVEQLPKNIRETYDSLIPDFRGSYLKHAQTAARTGIPEDLITKNVVLMYGPDAFLTKAKKTQAQFGVNEMNKSFDRLGEEVNSALIRTIKKTSGGAGVQSPKVAGDRIREGLERATKEMFDDAETRYSDVIEEMGDEKMQKSIAKSLVQDLSAMADEQLELSKSAITPQAKQTHVLNYKILRNVRRNLKEKSLLSAIETLQQLGKEAYGSEYKGFFPEIPRTVAAKNTLKDAWKNVHGAVITAISTQDPDLAAKLLRSNEIQRNFFENLEKISEVTQNPSLASEEVFKNLIMSGSSDQLAALKNLMEFTPEFNELKGQVLSEFIKRNPEEVPSFIPTINRFNSERGKMLREALFDAGDQNLRDFKELVELGRDSGVKNLNTSSTGVLNWMTQIFKSPVAAIEGIATGKGFVSALEKQAILKDMEATPIEQIVNLKGRGLYDEEMLDYAIEQKLSTPGIAEKYAEAARSGNLTPEIAQTIDSLASREKAETTYGILRDYLRKTGETLGVGLTPLSTPVKQATFMMNAISRIHQQSGAMPVLVPEEDRENVAYVINQSPMNSIQRAKNLKSLNSSGYLLDMTAFSEGDQDFAIIKKLMEEQKKVMGAEKRRPEIEADRPDILKSLMKPSPRPE